MHVYAFGSVCRGEIDENSDIDLLALVNGPDQRFDLQKFSVYTYERMGALWSQGNPFAWHLFLEARLVFDDDGVDVLRAQGQPSAYQRALDDCVKFREVCARASAQLRTEHATRIFELSNIFLAMRNAATCFSLRPGGMPVFSRHAALSIGEDSVKLPAGVFRTFMHARTLSTRGHGDPPLADEVALAASQSDGILTWMDSLIAKVRNG